MPSENKSSTEAQTLRQEIFGLRAERDEFRHVVQEARDAQGEEERELTDLRGRVSNLRAQISSLMVEIPEHTRVLAGLIADVAFAEEARDKAKVELAKAQMEADKIHTKSSLDLERLQAKQASLALQLQEEAKGQEIVRKELAARELTLTDLEKNLRVRELKVARAEAAMSDNQSLLNL